MRNLTFLAAGLALAACTTTPSQDDRTIAQEHLAALLAGKVAGPPMECVHGYEAGAHSLLAPQAIAIDPSPARVYVSSTAGTGCEGITGPSYYFVSKSHGPSGLCAGDIVQIRDFRTRAMVGTCSLAPFIPYTRQ